MKPDKPNCWICTAILSGGYVRRQPNFKDMASTCKAHLEYCGFVERQENEDTSKAAHA